MGRWGVSGKAAECSQQRAYQQVEAAAGDQVVRRVEGLDHLPAGLHFLHASTALGDSVARVQERGICGFRMWQGSAVGGERSFTAPPKIRIHSLGTRLLAVLHVATSVRNAQIALISSF